MSRLQVMTDQGTEYGDVLLGADGGSCHMRLTLHCWQGLHTS